MRNPSAFAFATHGAGLDAQQRPSFHRASSASDLFEKQGPAARNRWQKDVGKVVKAVTALRGMVERKEAGEESISAAVGGAAGATVAVPPCVGAVGALLGSLVEVDVGAAVGGAAGAAVAVPPRVVAHASKSQVRHVLSSH